MSQGAQLHRIERKVIEEIRGNRTSKFTSKESLDVQEHWEAIMFLLSGGNLGKELFVNIFMPVNRINLSNEENEWGPFIRWHEEESIKNIYNHLKDLSEEELRRRFDIERINKTVMHAIQEEWIEFVLQKSKETIELFRRAEAKNDYVIGSIG